MEAEAAEEASVATAALAMSSLVLLSLVATLVSALAFVYRPGRTVGSLKILLPRHQGFDWQLLLREHLESLPVLRIVIALIAVDISCSLLVMLAETEALEGAFKGAASELAESIGLYACSCALVFYALTRKASYTMHQNILLQSDVPFLRGSHLLPQVIVCPSNRHLCCSCFSGFSCLCIFLLEQILHLVAFGKCFFKHSWFVADFVVVLLSLVGDRFCCTPPLSLSLSLSLSRAHCLSLGGASRALMPWTVTT